MTYNVLHHDVITMYIYIYIYIYRGFVVRVVATRGQCNAAYELRHLYPYPCPKKVLQTSSCVILLYNFVLQTGLGMGMGINGTAQLSPPR